VQAGVGEVVKVPGAVGEAVGVAEKVAVFGVTPQGDSKPISSK
jgi:hypothetical protein